MLTYKELKNKPRELLTATGLKQDEFEGVLKVFAECYQERYAGQQTVSGQVRQRRQGGGNQGKLRKMEDKLSWTLNMIMIHQFGRRGEFLKSYKTFRISARSQDIEKVESDF